MSVRSVRTLLAAILSAALVGLPTAGLLGVVRVLLDVTATPPARLDAASWLLGLAAAGLAVVLGWAVLATGAGVLDAWAARAGTRATAPAPVVGPTQGRAAVPARDRTGTPGRLVQVAVTAVVLAALTAPAAGAAVVRPGTVATAPVTDDPGAVEDVAPPSEAAQVPGSWSALADEDFRAPRTVAPASAALVTGAPTRQPDEARQVVVTAGDSLWSLVEAHLGPGAGDAEVAAAWPAWWQANRSTIGDDPDLLLPGQLLTVPAPVDEETP